MQKRKSKATWKRLQWILLIGAYAIMGALWGRDCLQQYRLRWELENIWSHDAWIELRVRNCELLSYVTYRRHGWFWPLRGWHVPWAPVGRKANGDAQGSDQEGGGS